VDGKHVITVEGELEATWQYGRRADILHLQRWATPATRILFKSACGSSRAANADFAHVRACVVLLIFSADASLAAGIVMSVYALLREASYRGALSVADVELEGVLDGNLCRWCIVKFSCSRPRLTSSRPAARDMLQSSRPSSRSSALTSQSSSVGSLRLRLQELLLTQLFLASNGDVDPTDFVVPFNFAAAGLEEDNVAKPTCCGPNGHAKEVSTDGEIFGRTPL
jgi:hypothetical protein